MNHHTYIWMIMLLIAVISGCSDEDLEPITSVDDSPTKPIIEDKFRPYVDRFVEEGLSRGLSFDLSNLTVVEGIAVEEVCGYGYPNYNGTGTQRVEINDATYCWDERNDIEKEILMFHELGHAILNRPHKETNYPNTLPVSMMCSEACGGNQFFLYNKFTSKLRTYYLDELFDQFTNPPLWLAKSDTTQFYFNDLEGDNSVWISRAVNDEENVFQFERYDTSGVDDVALSISSAGGLSNESFAFWSRRFEIPDISESSELLVSVSLELQQITGSGVYLVIRTDTMEEGTNVSSGFVTTQRNIMISGTSEDQTLSVTLPYVPGQIDQLHIFLILDGDSSGKVYCKDIKVDVIS